MKRRIVLVLFSLIAAPAYLAFSLWGWGGLAGFFANPARIALAIILLLSSIAAAFTDSSGVKAGVREDKSNRWVGLLPLIISGFVLAWLPPYLDRHNELVMGGAAVRWIGVALSAMGCIIRLVPVFELGKRFSGVVAIQEGHTLKTDGIYRFIRHPSYLGLIIAAAGWALVYRAVVPAIVITAAIVVPLVARMNAEEKLLADQFGDEYAQYRKRTWRLIPWVY